MTYLRPFVTDEELPKFKEMFEKQGIHYQTDAEYREAANNLLGLFDVVLEMSIDERRRNERLEKEPKGFSMVGEGRNCSLCHRGVCDTDGWYDKWGFKCMNCQDAVNKKRIPGSLCGDWRNEKSITDSSLASRYNLHTQTVRKLIRRGKIKARQIPNGPMLILRKDNPGLESIIDTERTASHL